MADIMKSECDSRKAILMINAFDPVAEWFIQLFWQASQQQLA